jgi:restriction system protein
MARRRSRRSSAGAWTLYAGAIGVLIVISVIRTLLASPVFWVVLVPLAVAALVIWLLLTARRRARERERRRRWLYDQSCLPAADAMSGPQFERYVAELLRTDGHQDVRLVGGPGDGGADILCTEPSGRRLVIQCKRQLAPVPVGVVRQLNGTLAHEHPGRAGMLITTATLTRPAAGLAASAGITVIDRDGLARWMGDARRSIDP